MNKSDIIRQIAKRYGLPMTLVKRVVNDLFCTIMLGVLDGETIQISSFGKFYPKELPSIKTTTIHGDEKIIPRRNKVAFTPSSVFKNGFKNAKPPVKGGDKHENGS